MARWTSPKLLECQNPNCDDGTPNHLPFLFYRLGGKQRYCSEECRKEANKENNARRVREWRKKHYGWFRR